MHHLPEKSRVTWRKSTYSNGSGGSCVEIAATPGRVLIRDSKDREGPALAFSLAHWRAFAARVKAGELDLP